MPSWICSSASRTKAPKSKPRNSGTKSKQGAGRVKRSALNSVLSESTSMQNNKQRQIKNTKALQTKRLRERRKSNKTAQKTPMPQRFTASLIRACAKVRPLPHAGSRKLVTKDSDSSEPIAVMAGTGRRARGRDIRSVLRAAGYRFNHDTNLWVRRCT